MNYVLLAKNGDYLSDLVLQLHSDNSIQVCFIEKLNSFGISDRDKFYIPSDTVYPLVRQYIDDNRKAIIDIFRDKYKFRMKIANLFPSFYFKKANLSELNDLIFPSSGKYIVKPVTGFMGAGAMVINNTSNLNVISSAIDEELKKFGHLYPNIFSNEVIIEQYIDGGNEYAVDMYYDENGIPVIINIYCHPEARRREYLQMLYYTNKGIFEKFYDELMVFFEKLNTELKILSFAIHAEFKLNASQQLIPIEFNPCRFGGMGLADLTYHAFTFNPVKSFFDSFHPKWDRIWDRHNKDTFCWILGYNPADYDLKNYKPDHEKFKHILPSSSLIAYKELDFTKMPGFALAYLRIEQEEDLHSILSIEFNNCFIRSNSDISGN